MPDWAVVARGQSCGGYHHVVFALIGDTPTSLSNRRPLLANCSLAVLARVGLARAFVMQKDTANIKATDATAERFIGAANERKMRYGQLLDLALDALDRAGEGR